MFGFKNIKYKSKEYRVIYKEECKKSSYGDDWVEKVYDKLYIVEKKIDSSWKPIKIFRSLAEAVADIITMQ